MTDIDLARLKQLADGATPGPWELHGHSIMVGGCVNTYSGPVLGTIIRAYPTSDQDGDGREWRCSGTQSDNAAYIAGTQPRVVKTLIARVERAEAAITDIREAFVRAAYVPGDHAVLPTRLAAFSTRLASILAALEAS